jgi:uncharacterized protein YndB with AHSA1/START domain
MSRTIAPAPVRKTVRVAAPPARAFDVFTQGIGRWWPKSHHIGKADLDHAVIEPREGGRWYERGVDGSECEWGKVLVWEPPSRLVLIWQVNSEFTYDPGLITEVELRFIAEGNATRVELEHRKLENLGERAEALRQRIDAPNGWTRILESYADSASEQGSRS